LTAGVALIAWRAAAGENLIGVMAGGNGIIGNVAEKRWRNSEPHEKLKMNF